LVQFAVLAHHGHLRVWINALGPQIVLDSIWRTHTYSIILTLKLTLRSLTGSHFDATLFHFLICRNRDSVMCKVDVDFRNNCWLLVNRDILIIVEHALFATILVLIDRPHTLRQNSSVLKLVLPLHL